MPGKYFLTEIVACLSISLAQKQQTRGGWEMTTDDVVVGVSEDWVLACDVQEVPDG
jgi:hypothetical protein